MDARPFLERGAGFVLERHGIEPRGLREDGDLGVDVNDARLGTARFLPLGSKARARVVGLELDRGFGRGGRGRVENDLAVDQDLPGFDRVARLDIGRDLAVDSLALMNIIMELEDTFDISIPLDRLASVETAGDLSKLINDLRTRA